MMDAQKAYLANVQATYRYYCYHVHNADQPKLLWIPSKFHTFLCDRIQGFIERPTNKAFEILLISTPPQHGKLLADSTPVLTRKGWKVHGDLAVGDEVIGLNGKWVKVTHVHPKDTASLEVTMTNGEKIKCHPKHEWVVYDRNSHKERILEAGEIKSRIKPAEKKRGHRYTFQLPKKEFLQGDEKSLAVEPYVMGVWLGDGTNTKPCVCSCVEDIAVLDEIERFYKRRQEYIHKETGVITRVYEQLHHDLRNYGLCYYRKPVEKRISEEYLTASIEQRLELLAGLLDTDGSLDRKHNRYVFTTAEEKLKDSFISLVSTFGWHVSEYEVKPCMSTSGIQGKKAYWQLAFNPTVEIPCRLERKRIKHFSKQRKYAIESILPCEPEQGNCITVEGGVYLVGKRMIPTHNSTTVTETLGSWFLMKNPTKKVIEISYGDDLAQKFGKANMEKVRNFGAIFGVSLNKKKATPKEFELDNGKGRMISKGFGSGITGHSGDLIIIDDPIKNREEADSEVQRDSIWNEFLDSAVTRSQAGTKIVVIMTRWHEDDLVGRIEKNMPDHCETLNLPCEAEENDPLGREIGDALCPEIGKDNKWLKDFKTAYASEEGKRSWNALYQGRPTAREGNLIKREWWQYYKYEDYINGKIKIDTYVMSVDATFKDSKKNDFVAASVWGKSGNRIFLLHMSNKHLDFPSTIREIKVLRAKYPDISAILIEDKANGSGIIQTLRNEIMGIIPVEPYGSKESRVADVSYVIEAGNVFLPKDLSFTWEFVDQCSSFPNGKHDDMVDSMSQALERLVRFKSFRRTVRKQQIGERFFGSKKKKSSGRGDKINVI